MALDFTIIGYMAGTLTTFASLPQLIKSLKTKDMSGISPYFVMSFTTGLFLWLIYGLLRDDYPIIIFNIISLIFWIPLLYMSLRDEFNKNKSYIKQIK
ncbi:SemiSWEET transporter [Methanothermococcus sp. Ax23]|jgi:MtN3 and saliva related transmembrane protein|uniref:SemiSWEET transporter n=1 Tax=Methanothermococcus sp. Ax23 TaxID=3156486 RepID=UPI003B9FDBFC